MKGFFIDTSAFVAAKNARDKGHRAVQEALREALESGELPVTTNFILDEAITTLAARAGHRAAVEFAEDVHGSRLIEVLFVDPGLYHAALKIFKQTSDQDFSFTDCTSFALMKERKIQRVLTLDGDFEKFGFEPFPR